MADLTDKQAAFVDHYVMTWNATEAARRAGYGGDDTSLASIGWENLRKPAIQEAIAQVIGERVMGRDEVLARLSDQAGVDMSDFLKINGRVVVDLKRAKELGKLHLIKKIKKGPYGWEIELVDSQAALEKIGRALGIFDDKLKITGADGGPLEIHSDAIDKLFSRLLPDAAAGGETTAPAESDAG